MIRKIRLDSFVVVEYLYLIGHVEADEGGYRFNPANAHEEETSCRVANRLRTIQVRVFAAAAAIVNVTAIVVVVHHRRHDGRGGGRYGHYRAKVEWTNARHGRRVARRQRWRRLIDADLVGRLRRPRRFRCLLLLLSVVVIERKFVVLLLLLLLLLKQLLLLEQLLLLLK